MALGQAAPNPSVSRKRLPPPFTQGRLLAAAPASRRNRICAVTPKENPSCMLTQDGFRKGRMALRGILKGKALKRESRGQRPLAPLSS